MINLVRPYSRVSLQHIATALEITLEQAKDIVFKLILDLKLPSARIDQTNNVVELKGVTSKTESLRLAPLSNATDVPVLFEGKLRPLPVSLANSSKLSKHTILSEDQDLVSRNFLRTFPSNISSGIKENRTGDSVEQTDLISSDIQNVNDDTKVTGGNEGLAGATENENKYSKFSWDEPEFNHPQNHRRDMVLGTSLALSADLLVGPLAVEPAWVMATEVVSVVPSSCHYWNSAASEQMASKKGPRRPHCKIGLKECSLCKQRSIIAHASGQESRLN